MPSDALYEVAYDEAVRSLAEQEAVIDGLRSRAGVLFSAAAITTSFLGARALHGSGWSPFSWLALMAFVGVAAAFLAILWPRQWEVVANPHVVIKTYIESAEPVSIKDLHRELSFHIYGSYLANRGGLTRLFVYFQLLMSYSLLSWCSGSSLSHLSPRSLVMTEPNKPTRPLKPERPSPMMSVEPSFKEAIRQFIPRWMKRSSPRGHSS